MLLLSLTRGNTVAVSSSLNVCAGRLFFDLLNEPDAWNMTWSQPNINMNGQNANSSTVPAWGTLFTNTAQTLLTQEPALLFFAEGTGQRNQPGTAFGEPSTFFYF